MGNSVPGVPRSLSGVQRASVNSMPVSGVEALSEGLAFPVGDAPRPYKVGDKTNGFVATKMLANGGAV